MAQLDANIFLQQKGPDFDQIGEGFERGMRLGDMMRERKAKDLEAQKQQRIKDAMQSAVITNPDGSTTLDTKMTVGNLMKVDPLLARQKDAEFQQQELVKEQNRNRAIFTEALKAKQNPGYYKTAVENLVSGGYIKREDAPPVFDEGFINSVAAMTGTPADYLENQRKVQESQARLSETKQNNDYRREELGLRRLERKDAAAAKQNELNATQAKQVGNYKQGLLAEKQYQSAISNQDEYDPSSTGQIIDNSRWAPNWMKNNKAIEAQNAQDSWIETFLRDASGAAIAPSERGAYAEIYFEQPGDTDQVKANKKSLRQQKMDSAALASGRKDLIEPPGMSSAQNNTKPPWAK